MEPTKSSIQFVEYLVNGALPLSAHRKSALIPKTEIGTITDLTASFRAVFDKMALDPATSFEQFMADLTRQGKLSTAFQFNRNTPTGSKPTYAAIIPSALKNRDGAERLDDGTKVTGQIGLHDGVNTLESITIINHNCG